MAYKVRTGVLGEPADSPAMCALREQFRTSVAAQRLLSHRRAKAAGMTMY